MSKIWKITYKSFYGNKNQYWHNEVMYVYSEKKFNQEIKKMKEGTVEIFELSETIDIENYLSSLIRDNQLDSLLCVEDEKSIHHSKFIELMETVKVFEGSRYGFNFNKKYIDSLKKEWDFLKKSDEDSLKKFFAKHRTYLLYYANDSVEWFQALLSIYNFTDIKPIYTTTQSFNSQTRRYENTKVLVLDTTETQRNNFTEAKKNIKEIKNKNKKLKKSDV